MNLNNLEVRTAIEKKRLKYYEVAQAVGITQHTLSHWLKNEMSAERKARVLNAINSLGGKNDTIGAFEKIKEEMCDIYCKMPEFYLSQYKDPDEAHEVMVNECCVKCPLERLNK